LGAVSEMVLLAVLVRWPVLVSLTSRESGSCG